MKHNILEKIKNTIKRYNMIEPGDGVVVGLSGGPDSVCLFHSLCSLRDELDIGEITAVHINHGLRGAESDGDEESARVLAESMGAEFISFRYDVDKIAAETGEGTEEAGRRLRYGAFEKVRRQKDAARIAVAHNRNDQAETVLMRIMRGTGLRGLAGIDFIRADRVVIRPVLDLSRDEIERYCEENGLHPRIDSTNKEAIYTRNKIRLELLPEMKEKFNPNIVDALVRLSAQAREDEEFIMSAALEYADGGAAAASSVLEGSAGCGAEVAGGVRTQCESPIGDANNERMKKAEAGRASARWDQSESSLRLDGFEELHRAAAKRVIMLCAARAGMEQNMSAVNLEAALRLAETEAEGKETDLADGFYARVSYGKLWVLRRAQKSGRGAGRVRGGEVGRESGPTGARCGCAAGNGESGPIGARCGVEAAGGEARGSGERCACENDTAAVQDDVAAASAALPVHELEKTGSASIVFRGRDIKMRVAPAPAAAADLEALKKRSGRGSMTPGGVAGEPQRSVLLHLDFDLIKAKGSVVIRNRMPGDRISPVGMKGSKKLQDYFVDRKIPKHLRDDILLVVSGGRVIAAGREVSSECPVNAETKLILTIEY